MSEFCLTSYDLQGVKGSSSGEVSTIAIPVTIPQLNKAFQADNLTKINDETYILTHTLSKDSATHVIALLISDNKEAPTVKTIPSFLTVRGNPTIKSLALMISGKGSGELVLNIDQSVITIHITVID